MSEARLIVEQAGPLTSIQDRGRSGLARFGVPTSGPVDRLAFSAAQRAVDNPVSAAAVECSLGGMTIRCVAGGVAFSLAGGAFSAEIDGIAIPPWSVAVLMPDQKLIVREGERGNWGYVAFAGDLCAPSWLGSRSTHLLSGLGGGRLSQGSEIHIANARLDVAHRFFQPPEDSGTAPIRIILGPQERYFEPAALASFMESSFRTTPAFDRMGVVLDGPRIPPKSVEMPSEPAVRGALQVDGAGRVTLLLADHQTTAGYPKIAVIVDQDIDRLAQMRAGSTVKFVSISLDEALTLRATFQENSSRFLEQVSAGCEPLESRLLRMNLIDGVTDALAQRF